MCFCSCLACTVVGTYFHFCYSQSHRNSGAVAQSNCSLEEVNQLQNRCSMCMCFSMSWWVWEEVNMADLTGLWATKRCSLLLRSAWLHAYASSSWLVIVDREVDRQWMDSSSCMLVKKAWNGQDGLELVSIILRSHNLFLKCQFHERWCGDAGVWQRKQSKRSNRDEEMLEICADSIYRYAKCSVWKWDNEWERLTVNTTLNGLQNSTIHSVVK